MLEAIQQAEEEQRRMPVVAGGGESKEKPTLPIVEWDEKGELRLLPENLDDGGGEGGGQEAARRREEGGKGKADGARDCK